MTALTDEPCWAEFRRQMPVARRWAYFDHVAVAPLPAAAQAALDRWSRQATEEGDTVWPEWARGVEDTRRAAAELLRAQADEVALVPNTTAGITLVAEGFPWRPGDNLVTLDNEFPSNAYAWLNLADRGVETRRIATDAGRVDLARIAAACDARTRLISVSWVGYASGWRTDLDALVELARQRNVKLLVDAIQALGVFPLDVRHTPIDFLAADGHKWLLGPEGAGIFYLRREHLDLLRPIGVGWHSVRHASDYDRIETDWKPTAARYEGGTQNMAGCLALGASLRLLLGLGIEAIGRRVLEATDVACRRLTTAGAIVVSSRQGAERSGIVSFELPGFDPRAVRTHCLTQGVALACRGGRLRISPHAYCNDQDIERLIAALASVPGR
jgi:selenocysteine lyase/cysteine desulfurase